MAEASQASGFQTVGSSCYFPAAGRNSWVKCAGMGHKPSLPWQAQQPQATMGTSVSPAPACMRPEILLLGRIGKKKGPLVQNPLPPVSNSFGYKRSEIKVFPDHYV